MKRVTKDTQKALLRIALTKGPTFLCQNRKRLLKQGSKTLRFSPYLFLASKVVIKMLEKRKIL